MSSNDITRMCRECIVGWRAWLKLTGFPGNDISIVERANTACGEYTDAATCNNNAGGTAGSATSRSPPDTTESNGSWGLAIVPPDLASDKGVIDTGSCSTEGSCVAEYDKCYGSEITGSLRCCDGLICVRKSEFYGSCRDLSFLQSGDDGWSGEIVQCQ